MRLVGAELFGLLSFAALASLLCSGVGRGAGARQPGRAELCRVRVSGRGVGVERLLACGVSVCVEAPSPGAQQTGQKLMLLRSGTADIRLMQDDPGFMVI